jgi:TonB family protein
MCAKQGSRVIAIRALLVFTLSILLDGSLAAGANLRVDQQLKLGRQSLAAQEYGKAMAAFENASQIASGESWDAEIGLARALFSMGRYREALSHGRQALTLSLDAQQESESHLELGRSYYWGWPRMDLVQKVAMEKALEELGLATSGAPGLGSQTIGMQVAAHYQLGDKKEAEQLLQLFGKSGLKTDELAADIRCFLEAEQRSEPLRPKYLTEGGGETIKKPIRRRSPRPLYPESARKNGEQGLVVFEVIVSTRGAVECARPLKGLPYGLTEAALAAVRRWKYDPAQIDGEPVSVYFKAAASFFIE